MLSVCRARSRIRLFANTRLVPSHRNRSTRLPSSGTSVVGVEKDDPDGLGDTGIDDGGDHEIRVQQGRGIRIGSDRARQSERQAGGDQEGSGDAPWDPPRLGPACPGRRGRVLPQSWGRAFVSHWCLLVSCWALRSLDDDRSMNRHGPTAPSHANGEKPARAADEFFGEALLKHSALSRDSSAGRLESKYAGAPGPVDPAAAQRTPPCLTKDIDPLGRPSRRLGVRITTRRIIRVKVSGSESKERLPAWSGPAGS